jgi:hypothetical protein
MTNPLQWVMLGSMSLIAYYAWKDHQHPGAKLVAFPGGKKKVAAAPTDSKPST